MIGGLGGITEQAYRLALEEKRDLAFLRWQRSGYHDDTAHGDYLRWREEAANYLAKVRDEARKP